MKRFWSLREFNSNSSHYRTAEYGLDVVQQSLFQFVLKISDHSTIYERQWKSEEENREDVFERRSE